MPRLSLADPKAVGAPDINIFKGIANAPEILKGFLEFNVAVKKHGGLSPAEIEAIALAGAQALDCSYCLNAHTKIGMGAGLDEARTVAIRKGLGANPREKAIVDFTRAVLATKGNVSDADLKKMRDAGLDDRQITAVVAMTSIAAFTAWFNHVNGTVSDFPEAPKI
ncbi:MAG: carboxymuconolactone decarboxylase family protein [Planctomycetes bacterium]|nr:carboxymuconolactone decarboxylase family protein [Planctomycetota bacterium]